MKLKDDTTGDRLQKALQARDMSHSALARALRKRAIKGATQPTVSSYCNGDVEPRADFIRAVADELGVRAEWLLTGQGPMEISPNGGAELISELPEHSLPKPRDRVDINEADRTRNARIAVVGVTHPHRCRIVDSTFRTIGVAPAAALRWSDHDGKWWVFMEDVEYVPEHDPIQALWTNLTPQN